MEIEINNIFRLGKNQPVIKIEFLSYLAKYKVISNRHKLKGSRIYINEDLCEEDRGDFKLLRQKLNLARATNQKAYIRQKFLVVNGEKFSVDQLRKQTEPESEQEIINSAPNSPAPIARFKQMVTENEHLSYYWKKTPRSTRRSPY